MSKKLLKQVPKIGRSAKAITAFLVPVLQKIQGWLAGANLSFGTLLKTMGGAIILALIVWAVPNRRSEPDELRELKQAEDNAVK